MNSIDIKQIIKKWSNGDIVPEGFNMYVDAGRSWIEYKRWDVLDPAYSAHSHSASIRALDYKKRFENNNPAFVDAVKTYTIQELFADSSDVLLRLAHLAEMNKATAKKWALVFAKDIENETEESIKACMPKKGKQSDATKRKIGKANAGKVRSKTITEQQSEAMKKTCFLKLENKAPGFVADLTQYTIKEIKNNHYAICIELAKKHKLSNSVVGNWAKKLCK